MDCPFCDASSAVEGQPCARCGRSPRLPRRPCHLCQGWTPVAEKACCRCGAKQGSDLRWKVPLIIAIFVVAILVSTLLQLLLR